jgi:hypothetical protein
VHATGKGLKWAAQIRKRARSSWGLTPGATKHIYKGMGITRIMYGIDIWCTPVNRASRGLVSQGRVAAMAKLPVTERKSGLAITRGFKMLPRNLLEAHGAVLEIDVKVGKAHEGTASCMAR